jgi:arylsulfatase A-like enzyme
MGHHQTLFEEVIRVPLLIVAPGAPGGMKIETIVSLTDVGPTILDLAHIAAPPSFDGTSLRTLMGLRKPRGWWPFGGEEQLQREVPAKVAFSELIKETTNRQRPHERAVIRETHKLIENVDGGREYYDLQADPGERDTQGIDAAQRVVLGDAIARFEERHAAHPTPRSTTAMDAETRERMRALGYTE